MSDQIKTALDSAFSITMDKLHADKVRRFCFIFETTGTNPEALNTPFLGVTKIYFLPRDQEEFLDIFQVTNSQLSKLHVDKYVRMLAGSDIRKILSKLDAIDSSRKVQSDPFNIFITYLLHCTYKSNSLSLEDKQNTMLSLVKILQYKFFTSLVNHRFVYGTDLATMQSTINSLSNKFSIVQYGTWKKVMEVRAEELTAKNSIHFATITNYNNDAGIFYLITDIQTRIRNQINLIMVQYHKHKEENDKVSSYGLVGNDIDGEKVVVGSTSTLDSMTANISAEILSVHQFIDMQLIASTCKLFPGLKEYMFKQALERFSILALEQRQKNELLKVTHRNNEEHYVGASVLVRNIIQKTYRHCAQNKVNIKAKIPILICAKDAYSSSRIIDPDILAVRNSVGVFVDSCNITRREATKVSLKIAFILYIIIKSFKYI